MRYIRRVPPTNHAWSRRHSVQAIARRTADLVNVLSTENPAADAVADVLREHGEPDPVELSADDLAEMGSAALLLRKVFAADSLDRAVPELNRLLQRTAGPFRLSSHGGGTPWHPHLDSSDDAPWGEWFLASSCLALTALVWNGQRLPGGVCASTGCPNVFITQGSGPERRYCSRRCATRERVAAHRRSRR